MMTTDRQAGSQRHPEVTPVSRDLACAILLCCVEMPRVTVSTETIIQYDRYLRPVYTQSGWLSGADPLIVAVQEHLEARRDCNLINATRPDQGGWAMVTTAKMREQAVRRALGAKARALQILRERGILAQARSQGWKVFEHV